MRRALSFAFSRRAARARAASTASPGGRRIAPLVLVCALASAACTQPKPDEDPIEPVRASPAADDAAASLDDRSSSDVTPASGPTPVAAAGPSCAGELRCGDEGVSCCESPWLPGGAFRMGFGEEEVRELSLLDVTLIDREHPARVGGFFLDRFEITIGRFLAFAAEYTGPPAEGQGAHPRIAGSGWRSEWDAELPPSRDALLASVSCGAVSDPLGVPASSDVDGGAGGVDRLDYGLACLSWFQAFAFCIWDGGRLPTEAEWEYAASGGAEERAFPWGDDASVGSDVPTSATRVGRTPSTRGAFGHDDLAGGVFEWVLDGFREQEYAANGSGPACDECAELSERSPIGRVLRGAEDRSCCTGFDTRWRAASRTLAAPGRNLPVNGARCARDPSDAFDAGVPAPPDASFDPSSVLAEPAQQ